MIIAFIIIGLMISTIVVEVFTYVMNKDLKKINKRASKEQLRLSFAIDKIIADIRYKCVGSAFNIDDMYLISVDFGSDAAIQFLLTTHRKKATTFSDWWYYRKIYKRTGSYFSVNNYTFALEPPFKKDYKNFDELKENLMNDLSLQIKKHNITCKMKDLEKDFK